jgi:hypothetical protein
VCGGWTRSAAQAAQTLKTCAFAHAEVLPDFPNRTGDGPSPEPDAPTDNDVRGLIGAALDERGGFIGHADMRSKAGRLGRQSSSGRGHVCSGASTPASEVYAEVGGTHDDALYRQLGTDRQRLRQGWTTIMRLYARDDVQGELIGSWISRARQDSSRTDR